MQLKRVVITGLGLISCKRIVEGAGGSIHVNSQPGQGTCFELRLPMHEAIDGSEPIEQLVALGSGLVLGEAPNPLGLDGIEYIEYTTTQPQALGQALARWCRVGTWAGCSWSTCAASTSAKRW